MTTRSLILAALASVLASVPTIGSALADERIGRRPWRAVGPRPRVATVRP